MIFRRGYAAERGSTVNELFQQLVAEFGLKGRFVGYVALKNGNINETYVVKTAYGGGEREYLFQSINTNVFRRPEDLIANAVAVTEYMRSHCTESEYLHDKRRYVRFYTAGNGSNCFYDSSGRCWRVSTFIYDAVTYDTAVGRELFFTGKAFGSFQARLDGFPADRLHITIPDFHNTAKRISDLERAAKADILGRADECRDMIDYILSHSDDADLLGRLHRNGALPTRVTHNDTKCNNVMFDKTTGEPIAVIDLDTVMPGLMGHDFGDAVRFAASSASEDCEDIKNVYLDMSKFTSFAEGFLPEVSHMITENEHDTLADSVYVITLELASRFLTDYLSGDTYFITKKPRHNFHRAACQVTLAKSIHDALPAMRKIVNDIE